MKEKDEIPEDETLEDSPYSGPILKRTRERLRVDLLALAKEIKLRPDLVRALEEERFADLPQEPYLKGHLRAYARQLDLAPEKVVEDYLARYRAWKDRSAS